METDLLFRLMAIHGPDSPLVVEGMAGLPSDHPVRVKARELADVTEARRAAQVAAAAARSRAGTGSVAERLADIETRVAALEG